MIENPQESEEEIKEKLYQSSPISLVEYNIHQIESLANYAGFKKIFLESAWRAPTNFSNNHQAMLFRMRRYAAKSFVANGHSSRYFWKLVAQKKELITSKLIYYNSLKCVVRDAYRFLQSFILDDCLIQIEKLRREVFKMLFYGLIHCRKAFKNDECEAFLSIIKTMYGLEDVTLDEYSAVKLFLAMQRKLRISILKKLDDESRPAEVHTPISTNCQETRNILYQKALANNIDAQNVWTVELEQELIAVYKRIQHCRDIKKYFREKHPYLKKFLEGRGIRNRLNQIICITLRRLQQIIEKNSDRAIALPPISKKDDNKIAYIVTGARCLKARLMLVDLYITNTQSYTPQVEAVIREINEAIEERHRYNLHDFYVRKYEALMKKQKDAKDDTLSILSYGSKCYAPTRAKDLISVVPFKENARKIATLSKFYYKQQAKFIGYARQNDESQNDTISDFGSEASLAYRLEKKDENQSYDNQFYWGEEGTFN